MDEFSSVGTNHCRLVDGDVKSFTLPDAVDEVTEKSIAQLAGGDVTDNTAILREILIGNRKGVVRETVILNSGALLYMAGITPSLSLLEEARATGARAIVSASAITTAEEAKQLINAGFDGLLIGTAFLQAPDLGKRLNQFSKALS